MIFSHKKTGKFHSFCWPHFVFGLILLNFDKIKSTVNLKPFSSPMVCDNEKRENAEETEETH